MGMSRNLQASLVPVGTDRMSTGQKCIPQTVRLSIIEINKNHHSICNNPCLKRSIHFKYSLAYSHL